MKANRKTAYVVVYPAWRTYRYPTFEEQADTCWCIKADIERHVDGYEEVAILHGTEACCSHCGGEWQTDSDDYNGGCCVRDEERRTTP